VSYAVCDVRATRSALSLTRGAHGSAVSNASSTASSHLSRCRSKRDAPGKPLTTPAAAKRARERAHRLKEDADWLLAEADQFENMRKTDAIKNAREKAKEKQHLKALHAPKPGRPLTNAMFRQPQPSDEDVKEEPAATKRTRSKRDDSNDSEISNARLQVGNPVPGKFVFWACSVLWNENALTAGNLFKHFIVIENSLDKYTAQCTLDGCDTRCTIKKSSRR